MADQICTIAIIQAKARTAFERGLTIDDHHMNHGAAALATWQAEFRRLQEEAAWIRETDREVTA